jgi:hypothetical protein
MVDRALGGVLTLRVTHSILNICVLGARIGSLRTLFSFEIRAGDINPLVSTSSTANISAERIRLDDRVSVWNPSAVGVVIIVLMVCVEVSLSLNMICDERVVRYIASFGSTAPNTLKQIFSAGGFAGYVLYGDIRERLSVPVSLHLLDMSEIDGAHFIGLA